MKIKSNFSLTEKYFSFTNFSNGKQTQESLESGFQKTISGQTNTPLIFCSQNNKNNFYISKLSFF
jgi:hypothetical protein